jgi:hypothetical protein
MSAQPLNREQWLAYCATLAQSYERAMNNETITDDTPEGNAVEELQWTIGRLREQLDRHIQSLASERDLNQRLRNQINDEKIRYNILVGRFTVRDLRKAGVLVEITVPDDDCDCE